MSQCYQYEPLSNAQEKIRVAILQPGQYRGRIVVSFCVRKLRPEKVANTGVEPKKLRKYEALSYAWGSDKKKHSVLVKKHGRPRGTIAITKNLHVALKHLRSRSRNRSIWIDAICINQSNDIEKGMQVAMMGKIFSLASDVIVWIGPEKDQSNEALDMMHHWASQVEVDWEKSSMGPSKRIREPHWAQKSYQMPYRNGELEPVCSLLRRPYFGRLWARQEAALASSAFLQCGHKILSLPIFQKAIWCLCNKGFHARAVESASTFVWVMDRAFEICDAHHMRCVVRLRDMRFRQRHAICHDERDSLFAVLGLLHPQDQALGIKPDYTREAKDLFRDTAKDYIRTKRTLELLETCEISTRVLEIPSWVPDWSSRLRARSQIYSNWSACGWISPRVEFEEKDRIRISGARVSNVKQVIKFDSDERSVHIWVRNLRELRSIGCLERSQNRHENGCLRTLCNGLLGDQVAELRLPPREALKTFVEYERLLELIFSSDERFEGILNRTDGFDATDIMHFSSSTFGRYFVQMQDHSMGLVPTGTQVDDIVAVILGCRFPVILRPVSTSEAEQTWQVVGTCQISGLMHGEAIYRNRLPGHLQFVRKQETVGNERISGWPVALYDPETGQTRSDPAEILEEVGIKVERYERKPHRLEVLPETLRAAGIPLEDFVLV